MKSIYIIRNAETDSDNNDESMIQPQDTSLNNNVKKQLKAHIYNVIESRIIQTKCYKEYNYCLENNTPRLINKENKTQENKKKLCILEKFII